MNRSLLVGAAFTAGIVIGFAFAAPPRPPAPPAAPTEPALAPLTASPVRSGERVVVTEPGPLRGKVGTVERAYHAANRHLVEIDGTGYEVPDTSVVALTP